MSLIDKIAKGGPGGVYSEHVLPGTVGPVAPAKPFAEVGVTGLLRTRGVGYVYEEWLNNLSTYRQRFVYREMRDNDAVIGSMFFALEMILRKAEWRVEPAPGAKGDEYAAFLHSCMEDMCYDDATEVLAKRGWVLFKDLREGDLLAQRTSKGVLEYVKPKALHVHDFDGELMGNAGDAVDFLVTPTHRMLFAKKHGRKHDKNQKHDLQIHRCEDVYGKSGWVSKGAGWAGKSTTRGMDWLEFLGFFVADGCASKRQVVLIQKEAGYVENLLRRVDLFDKAKRRPVNGSYQWVISDVRLAESLREDFGVGSRNKRLPSWLKDATAVEIKRFLIGHAEGDGTECETGLVRHYTSSKLLADDIQEVAIKAGYATTLLERVGSKNSFAPGVKNYGVSLWSQEEHLHPYLKAERNWYKRAYKGKVYCASVPSGVLMVRRNGKPMWCGNSHTWEDFIAESVSMFAFGFALFETVYKKRNGPDGRKASRFDDGLIGWRKMAPRAQESILYWVWDDDGGLQGAVQLAAPDYHTVPMPIEKLLLFRTTSLKNNPEGRSILRNVYRSWFFKRRIEEVEGIGIERDLCGIPTLYVGAEALAAMGGEQAAKQLVTNIRVDDQAGVILPLAYDDNKNPLVKLELLRTAGAKQTDAGATIGRYNSDILNTMLAGFVQFGQTPTGSRSLHMSATQIFSLAIGAFMDSVAAVMNRIAIPRLMRLNKMDLKSAPKLVAGEIGVRDLEELSTFCQQLSMAGLTFFDKPTQNYIRKIARLPQLPDDDEDNKPPVPDASVPADQNGPMPDPVKGAAPKPQDKSLDQPGALPAVPRTRATGAPTA